MANAGSMTIRRGSENAIVVGSLRRSRAALLCSTALQAVSVLVIVVPAQAGQLPRNAQPQGGTVVVGTASISQTPATTTVQQSSQLAAVNWNSFNVGSAQTVTFQQPSASATTLNRVVGPDPSEIAGHITANGNVVLVNRSGVVFDQGSQVNVNSLVVSAADITNQNFMNSTRSGKADFAIKGNPSATIVNRGTITVQQSGLAALVAPAVANQGVINARMGKVVLAGATAHTVDLYGDGLLSIDVTGQVQQMPVGAGGQKVTALVTNTGTILAQGGTITLTAAAADGIVNNLVTAGGKISADRTGGAGGSIVLNGVGGSLVVQGEVSARGTTGGSVQALADHAVTVASTANIDVSGVNGGGSVALGTTLARAVAGPSLKSAPVAKAVTVAPGAVVKADATGKGNGGTIAVLSSNSTAMAGSLSARGGALGGNGGFVEVSGRNAFQVTGSVDVRAPLGQAGTILLDPTDLYIANGGTGTLTGIGEQIVDPSFLSGNVMATATNNITINSPILANYDVGDLTLTAGQNIYIYAQITVGGTLTLYAGSNISAYGAAGVTASTLTGYAGGSVYLTGSTTGPSSGLLYYANGVANLANFTGTANFFFANGQPLTVTGAVSTQGEAEIIAAGALTVNKTASVAGASKSFLYGYEINLNGKLSSSGGAAVLQAGDSIALANGSQISALNGDIVLATGDAVPIQGYPSSAAVIQVNNAMLTSGGNLYLLAGTGGTVSIGAAGSVQASGIVSIVADTLAVNAGAAIQGAQVEIAPAKTGAEVSLGAGATGTGLVIGGTVLGALIGSGPLSVGAASTASPPANAPVPPISTPSPAVTTAGSIDVAGAVSVGTNTLGLYSTGAITEEAGGIIAAGTLTGSAGGAVALTGANQVNNLGDFAASGFSFTNNSPLTVIGTVNGGSSTTINSGTNALTVGTGGVVQGSSTVALTGSAISINGSVNDGGSSPGSGTITLSATGTIGESGTLVAGTLNGTAAGAATLTGANQVSNLGSFSASGLQFTNNAPLTVNGTVNGGSSTTINTGTNALTVGTGGVVQGGSTVALTGGAISIDGSVIDGGSSPGSGMVTLSATGTIAESGTLVAGTLNGTATGAATLTGANQVSNLGSFSASGLQFTNNGPLTVIGTVNGGSSTTINTGTNALTVGTGGVVQGTSTVALTGSAISINGSVNDGGNSPGSGTITLSATGPGATGTIDASGTLIAGTLIGNATGTATLTGANQVTNLGGFSAAGLTFIDTVPLTIDGNISAPSIQIGAPGLLTVANGVTVTTGFEQLDQVQASQAPPDSDGSTGLNLAILNGAGSIVLGSGVSMQPTSGAGETVRLALTGGGSVQFNDFNAPNADLLLHVGSGSASGSLNVANLSAFYQSGNAGPINLTGSVGGQSGGVAASVSRIGQEPTAPAAFAATTNASYVPGPTFQVNQCPISLANCGLITPVAPATLPVLTPVLRQVATSLLVLPVAGPLAALDATSTERLLQLGLSIAVADSQLDDPDLLLPYISDRDN